MKNNISLDNFAGGALHETFNRALNEVLENIVDLNTPHDIKRKLTLELNFVVDENREISPVEIIAKTKLAHNNPVTTTLLIDSDLQGTVLASEWNNQLKGQQMLEVDEETGEILNDKEDGLEGITVIK